MREDIKGKKESIRVVLAGAIALAVVMGIGRFAYTPIFPVMQDIFHFSEEEAGYLASVNYVGYLLGALAGGLLHWKNKKIHYLKIHIGINIISTLGMAASTQFSIWMFFRLVSGSTSGLVFVLVSSILLDYLAFHKKSSWSGFFYSGVGLGIVLTGLFTPVFAHYFGWQGTWFGLGFLALLLVSGTIGWLKEEGNSPAQHVHADHQPLEKQKSVLGWLTLAYGCEGLGYIISGTFLVAMIKQLLEGAHISSISWVLVGIAAIPSCFVWAFLGKRWGYFFSLKVAYVLQALGIMLPFVSAHIYVVFLGAVLFGGTFMGITTLAVSAARHIQPYKSNKVISYLTVAYGLGQIIGPSIAGLIVSESGSYLGAFIFAAGILVLGIFCLIIANLQYKSGSRSVTFQK